MRKYNPIQNPKRLLAVLCLSAAWSVSAQTLAHRYSFDDPAGSTNFVDSVGGADGALDNSTASVTNSASLDGSELVLDGNGGFGSLPSGLISTNAQVTIEFWASVSNVQGGNWTRVFAFGDQNGSVEDTGLDYSPNAPGGSGWQNLNFLTGSLNAGGGYANNPGPLLGLTNAHVTCIVDPVSANMYYYNGDTVVSTLNGTVPPLSDITDTFGLIGRSLDDVDPVLAASIFEFRIYNGVLPRSQIALNDATGPHKIVTSAQGTVQAVHFSSPVNPLQVNQSVLQIFTGDFTNVTGLDLIGYGGGATFVSGNTAVLTVGTNGVVKGITPGTTTVVASYGGLKATNTLTVFALPATLTHRYSFTNGTANDIVGGANGTLMGDANISNGQLVLDGTFGTYLGLPSGIINLATNSAVTFDAWVAFGNAQTWAYLFGFGNTNNGQGLNQLGCEPSADSGGFHNWGMTENWGGGQTVTWAHSWNNVSTHITVVLDPPTSTCSVYRDGVLQIAQYNFGSPLSNVATNYGFIGRSFYSADPYLLASLSEFRIYNGALTPWQVGLLQEEGPSSTNLNVGAISSIVVVPTNYPAYASLVAPVILANYANLANFNLVPMVQASDNANLGGPQGLVVTSSDPSIISVNTGNLANLLTTHRPGKVTLTASFGGKTNSATVWVKNEAVLTHEYSFDATGSTNDSVGGADGTLQGGATIQQGGGGLQLDGSDGDYLALPGGLLQNYNAVTVDAWVNFGAAQHWARLWEFADTGPATQNELYFAPGWNGTPNANSFSTSFPWGATITPGGALQNASYHITCVYGDGTMEIYTNAVLESSAANMVAPASSAGTVFAGIGHSPYSDPGLLGSVAEFRIYNGLLAPDEILASDLLGPNQTLSTRASLSAVPGASNVTLSWPLANAGFSVQASSSLTSPNWINLTNVPALVGGTWQVTLPANGGPQFFRLWR